MSAEINNNGRYHAPRGVMMEGYLKKKSPRRILNIGSWQRRYFVLPHPDEDGNQALLYYTSINERGKEPIGVIPISMINRLDRVIALHKQDAQCRFYIQLQQANNNRVFNLSADTIELRDAWIEALEDAVAFYRESLRQQQRSFMFPMSSDESPNEETQLKQRLSPQANCKPEFWKRKSLLASYSTDFNLVPVGHSDWELQRPKDENASDSSDNDDDDDEVGPKENNHASESPMIGEGRGRRLGRRAIGTIQETGEDTMEPVSLNRRQTYDQEAVYQHELDNIDQEYDKAALLQNQPALPPEQQCQWCHVNCTIL